MVKYTQSRERELGTEERSKELILPVGPDHESGIYAGELGWPSQEEEAYSVTIDRLRQG